MIAGSDSPLRIVVFGDLEIGVWGAVLGGETAVLLVDGQHGHGRLDAADDSGDWNVTGDGLELTMTPIGPAVRSQDDQAFDQLCRVHGNLGAERPIDCMGRRATRALSPGEEYESIRDVSAWFGAEEGVEGVALTSLRPRKARGHDRDVIAAAVLDAAVAAVVADPRLSTTYNDQGLPSRVGLELWLEEDEDGEPQYPRRAAGQATGSALSAANGGYDLVAQLLRCQSRGNEGTGVYLLMRRR